MSKRNGSTPHAKSRVLASRSWRTTPRLAIIISTLLVLTMLTLLILSDFYQLPVYMAAPTKEELNLFHYRNPFGVISSDIPVPKVIHQMSGTESVSVEYASFAKTALSTNPKYRYVFWTDVDCLLLVDKVLPHISSDYRRIRVQGQSDYCRFLLLHIFGGIYADLDYVFLRSFDEIKAWRHADLHKFNDELITWEGGGKPDSPLSFFVSEEPSIHGPGIVNIALMGSAPKHSFTREALGQFRGFAAGSVNYISDWFPTYQGDDLVTLFSNEVFAPLTDNETHFLFREHEAEFGEMAGHEILELFEAKVGRTLDHAVAAHMWGCFYCPKINKYKQTSAELLEISNVLPNVIRGHELIESLETVESER